MGVATGQPVGGGLGGGGGGGACSTRHRACPALPCNQQVEHRLERGNIS